MPEIMTKCTVDGCSEYAWDGHCHVHNPTCLQVGHLDGGPGPCERCPPPPPGPFDPPVSKDTKAV